MTTLTIERPIYFRRKGRGFHKELHPGPEPSLPALPGRVPRVARLMALALRFDQLLREGAVASYAELARLGHVTPARVSQIMNMLGLAPDLQEQLLFLPPTERGRDPIILHQLQPIAQVLDWKKQRRLWQDLVVARCGTSVKNRHVA
jgi:hypothetical protein